MQLATGDLEAQRDTTRYVRGERNPERIVIFGKGGIGKSTIAANLSSVLADSGRKVMHIGCDPKADSTSLLVERERMAPVLAPGADKFSLPTIEEMIITSRIGVDCLEAGGPSPGVGCGGRGVSLVLQLMQREKLVERRGYDAVLFDVLGDVVCGGFAAPLRKEFGEKVVIVMSEELMALYAANNIGRAVLAYWDNGVRLVGLIANCKDPTSDKAAIHRFARMLNTRVLAFVPRDTNIRDGEFHGKAVVEFAPEARITEVFRNLAEEIFSADVNSLEPPTPLSNSEFYEMSRAGFPEEAIERRRQMSKEEILAELSEGLKPSSQFKEHGPPGMSGPLVDLAPPKASPFKILNTGDALLAEAPAAPQTGGGCGSTSRGGGCGSAKGGGSKGGGCSTSTSKGEPKPVPGVRRPPGDEFNRADSIYESWRPDRRWRQFFCDEAMSLNVVKLDMENLTLVMHEELECHFVNARTDDGTVSFVNYPWPDHTGPGLSTFAKLREKNTVVLVSDIGDEEIVLGGGPKLQRMLDRVDRDEERKTKINLIMLLGSCPPTINGDDHFGIVGTFSKRSGIPIVHLDNSMDQERDFFVEESFRIFSRTPEFQANAEARKDPANGNLVNLMGFPKDATWVELTGLLGEMGGAVNTCLLPEVDIASMKAFPRANLVVLRDHRSYELIYKTIIDELEDDLALEVISPMAPYGLRHTRRWLEAVGERLALPDGSREAIDRREASVRPHWEALTARVAGRRVAFVVDEARVHRLSKPRFNAGIPMIDFLREAGFGIDLLCYCEKCDSNADNRHPAYDPNDPKRTHVRYFHTPEELDALLESDAFQAVYSELYFDYRVTRAGKSQITMAQFEAGYEGAVRTLDRLLGVVELPFYTKYRSYLRQGSLSVGH